MHTQHKSVGKSLTQMILDDESQEQKAEDDTDTGKTKECFDLNVAGITPKEFAVAHP